MKGPNHNHILLGLVLGGGLGTALHFVAARAPSVASISAPLLTNVFEPAGQIFLRLLFMVVVPLVFASIALGVLDIGDGRRLGRIGAKTMLFFVVVTAAAVVIGLVLVDTIRPGDGLSKETRERLLSSYRGEAATRAAPGGAPPSFGPGLLVQMVPRNPLDAAARGDMLAVIVFALAFGLALRKIDARLTTHWKDLLRGLSDAMVVLIEWTMRLAPFGVFALVFTVTARFGWELLQPLAAFVGTVLLGLTLHLVLVYSLLVKTLARLSPIVFFRKIKAVLVTAFSTSSSNATLPTTIDVTEKNLGVPSEIAGFVLPLGATMNMNGTALFEGVAAVFLAQVFGISLDLPQQLLIVALSVLTAIGTAGVPGGSIPLLVLVITSVGVPAEGIAIIIGVDRLLDMCRTVVNVVGDVACAAVIAKSEGHEWEA